MSRLYKIFVIITIILAIVVLASFVYFSVLKKPGTVPVVQEDIKVTNVIPGQATPLQPGNQQTFSLDFNNPIRLDSIQVKLTRADMTINQAEVDVAFTLSLNPDGKTLIIGVIPPISPLSEYHLLITGIKDKSMIFEARYLSEKPLPTPVKTNNLQLVPYLPHETSLYRLIYLESQNIYVFNFKYNPDSPDELETQFNKAKQEAIKFINSRGVDPNSIIIEWRYS